MAFEEIKENVEDLKNQAMELFDSNVEYYKLLGFKILVKSATGVMKGVLLAILMLMVIVFLSTAAALGIGYWLGNHALGFLIVGGIYLLLAMAVLYLHDKMVQGPLMAKFSKMLLNKQ
ncbi:MAG: competence protein [Flavobacterium sp.]|nr:MAG: competence protein [Flavobacterium sp.]